MKIVIAPDSFKGSLTSKEIIDIVKEEIVSIFPTAEIIGLPLADGGEGTLYTLMETVGKNYEEVLVKDPLFQNISSCYGVIDGNKAVVEMAKASGLTLVPKERRNPLKTTTFGTGQLIKAAIDKGYKDIVIGLGGSATNDGGMGMLAALGVVFYDKDGAELSPIGENLIKIADFDDAEFRQITEGTFFTVMCDITNPLLGEKGATYTFGPQKGADESALRELEAGMENFSRIAQKKIGKDTSGIPGTGAAGGLGWAFCEFFNAELKSGIETVLNNYEFDNVIKDADLVISGEGHADSQSVDGKLLSGLGKVCKENKVPLLAIVGGMSPGAERLLDMGVSAMVATVNDIMDLDYAMENARVLLKNAARSSFRLIEIGMKK